MQNILDDTEVAMQKAVQSLEKELGTINIGRATPSLLDTVRVDCYGNQLPLNRMANISVPDPLTLVIQVWDKNLLSNAEKAILAANLGLNPIVDGLMLRISIPRPSEERRRELCKNVKRYGEDKKIVLRGLRKDALEKMKKMKKDLREDLVKDFEKKVQDITDKHTKLVDHLVITREKILLTL
jgi:ribosome recycling factor